MTLLPLLEVGAGYDCESALPPDLATRRDLDLLVSSRVHPGVHTAVYGILLPLSSEGMGIGLYSDVCKVYHWQALCFPFVSVNAPAL